MGNKMGNASSSFVDAVREDFMYWTVNISQPLQDREIPKSTLKSPKLELGYFRMTSDIFLSLRRTLCLAV